jgi:uncharacterized protein
VILLNHMQEKIKALIKESMMARDSARTMTLRGLSSAFTNELVAQGRPPQEVLADSDCVKVIKRLIKQRKDSIEQFTQASRSDLADDESVELVILESLLPAQMTREEVVDAVKKVISELGDIDMSKKGQITGQIIKSLGDNADGKMVKEVLDELLK